MSRFYILRHRTFPTFFAGFKPGVSMGAVVPVFVMPNKGYSCQASLIHEDDIAETEADLAKYGIETDRVQVG